LIKSI